MSAAAPNPSVAQLESILADLILERQRLRRDDADRPLLEANRLAIVYWQQELMRVLGDEHRGAA